MRKPINKKFVGFYLHVCHKNVNLLWLAIVFSESLKWKTLKKYRMTIEENNIAIGMLIYKLFFRQFHKKTWLKDNQRSRLLNCFKLFRIRWQPAILSAKNRTCFFFHTLKINTVYWVNTKDFSSVNINQKIYRCTCTRLFATDFYIFFNIQNVYTGLQESR